MVNIFSPKSPVIMRVGIILPALLMILATSAGCSKDINLSKYADNTIGNRETLEPRLLDTTLIEETLLDESGHIYAFYSIAGGKLGHRLGNNETETKAKYITAPVSPVLVVESTPGGSVIDPGEGSLTYTLGIVVNLTAEPETGFTFFKWEGDVSTVADVYDSTTTITMNNDYEITALFSVWTLDLSEGWNILSTPIALDPCCNQWSEFVALDDGLNIDPGAISYYFNGASKLWEQVLAGYALYPCDAIYVKMANADTVKIIPSSRPSVASKKLYPGWNLISLAALEQMGMGENQMPVDLALTSIYLVKGDNVGYTEVVSPPAGQDSWYYFRDAKPCDVFMGIGKGCWVYMMHGGTLGGFTCTPW